MNLNHIFLFIMQRTLCAIVLVGCTIFDVSDELDYAPSVKQASGCWLSAENLEATVYVRTGPAYSQSVDIVDEIPEKTCMELCIHEDSTFTFVGKITGKGVHPDVSLDLHGIAYPDTMMYLGGGGLIWYAYWSRKNYTMESSGDSTMHGYDFENDQLKVRLVENHLSGVSLWSYGYNEDLSLYNESGRVYHRTNDKDACKNLESE